MYARLYIRLSLNISQIWWPRRKMRYLNWKPTAVAEYVFMSLKSEAVCAGCRTQPEFITMASQITSLTIVYSAVYSGADQRKHQSSASLAFVRGIHRGPVNSPHKWPVTRKIFPFDDVIMCRDILARLWADSNSITVESLGAVPMWRRSFQAWDFHYRGRGQTTCHPYVHIWPNLF